jgi:hypothetical protein
LRRSERKVSHEIEEQPNCPLDVLSRRRVRYPLPADPGVHEVVAAHRVVAGGSHDRTICAQVRAGGQALQVRNMLPLPALCEELREVLRCRLLLPATPPRSATWGPPTAVVRGLLSLSFITRGVLSTGTGRHEADVATHQPLDLLDRGRRDHRGSCTTPTPIIAASAVLVDDLDQLACTLEDVRCQVAFELLQDRVGLRPENDRRPWHPGTNTAVARLLR